MASPLLSVAMVNWNTRDLLLACLTSLAAESSRLPLEIIVVDNASSDRSSEAIRTQFPEVRLLENDHNAGFALAMNQALRLASAPYLCLLNPDCEIKAGALLSLCQELQGHADILAIGPQLLNTDGSIQRSGRKLPSLLNTLCNALLPERVKKSDWFIQRVFGRTDFTQPAQVEELSGACFLTRRELFEKVGWLDEAFFLYYEEVDWFRRIAALPGRVIYYPQARIVHHWGASAKQAGEAWLWNYRSEIHYWRKAGLLLAAADRLLLMFVGFIRLLANSLLWLVRKDKKPVRKSLALNWKIILLGLGARNT
jgi:N-acetylglucosaminyl-diphospho-decaprenol L-rhamnosyltransferase